MAKFADLQKAVSDLQAAAGAVQPGITEAEADVIVSGINAVTQQLQALVAPAAPAPAPAP
jgi:hypothetical protein